MRIILPNQQLIQYTDERENGQFFQNLICC